MKKFYVIIFALVMCVLGLFICQWASIHWGPSSNTVQNVRKRIDQAHLIGKNPEVVSSFLASQGMKHTPYSKEGKNVAFPRLIAVSIDDVPQPLLGFHYFIDIVFYFDKNNQLERYEIEKVYIAP